MDSTQKTQTPEQTNPTTPIRAINTPLQTSQNAEPTKKEYVNNPEAETPETQNSSNMRNIISTIALFLAAPLLALILILFVIQSYEVDGPSMEQTLQNKDLLIVSKIPKTVSRITGKDYIPKRGEIIIFTRDESNLGGQGVRQLVKRVVALPGERITVKDGAVTVYNQEQPNGFNPDALNEFTKNYTNTPGNVDFTVQEGQVFVLGDNRNNSLDSRYFGPVRAEDIVGDLAIRIFPLNEARTF